MDTTALEAIEATDTWRNDVRQHGVAYVTSDDLAKQYRKQLKPIGQTIKETRENVIQLMNAKGVSKIEIGELGVTLRVVQRQAKKAPPRSRIKDRCVSYFEEQGRDAETAEEEGGLLFERLFQPDVSEGFLLRRGQIVGGLARGSVGQEQEDEADDEALD